MAELTDLLTAQDRCDACSAAARARIELASGSHLLMCSHHAHKHLEALSAHNARIHWAQDAEPIRVPSA